MDERLRELYSEYDSKRLRKIASSVEYGVDARQVARTLLEERGESTDDLARPATAKSEARATPWLALGLAGVVVAGVVAGAWVYSQREPEPEEVPPWARHIAEDDLRIGPAPLPPLHSAAIACDAQRAQRLLREGDDPDETTTDDDASYALVLAAGRDCEEVVDALLDAEADVNVRETFMGREGHTALTKAITRGSVDVVRRLLDANADANRTGGGKSPLYHAIEGISIIDNFDRDAHGEMYDATAAIIEALVDAGADVDGVESARLVALVDERFASEPLPFVQLEMEEETRPGAIPVATGFEQPPAAETTEDRDRFYAQKRLEILALLGVEEATESEAESAPAE